MLAIHHLQLLAQTELVPSDPQDGGLVVGDLGWLVARGGGQRAGERQAPELRHERPVVGVVHVPLWVEEALDHVAHAVLVARGDVLLEVGGHAAVVAVLQLHLLEVELRVLVARTGCVARTLALALVLGGGCFGHAGGRKLVEAHALAVALGADIGIGARALLARVALLDEVALALLEHLLPAQVFAWVHALDGADRHGVKDRLKDSAEVQVGDNGERQPHGLEHDTSPVLLHHKQDDEDNLGKVHADKHLKKSKRVVPATVVCCVAGNVHE